MDGLVIKGIKCDTCAFHINSDSWGTTPEEILSINDYYLNMPCPKCGASLLTPADHKAVKRLVSVMRILGKISKWVAKLPFKCCKAQVYNVQMNGTGQVQMKQV